MKKIIKVKTDSKTGEGFINIKDFEAFVDINKVHSYKLTELSPGKAINIEFYDKNGNKIKTIK